MSAKASLLLNLDLATQDVHSDEELRAVIHDDRGDTPILRATAFGAPVSPTGSPSEWDPAADAVFRMAHEVRRAARAQGHTSRIFVTGRAGLPLFVQLGATLSARVVEFSLLNRRKDSALWDRLDFPAQETPGTPPDAPFFAVREGLEGSHRPGRVAITVSTSLPRAPAAAREFLLAKGEPIAGEVEIRTHRATPDGAAVTWLTGDNAPKAAAELMDLFGRLPILFPNAKGLSVFIDGPATLAFLVGRSIVPRLPLHHDVWVPSFHGGKYHDALRLPYRPTISLFVIHADQDRAFAERLQTTLVGAKVRFWHTGMIGPGEPVDQVTQRRLDDAKIIVVLVSSATFANDATHDLIPRALDHKRALRSKVVPVLAREYHWKAAIPELGALQALPTGERWLQSATASDDLWADVDRGLRRVVDEVRADLFGEEV
jgi:hypothetical protein